MSVLNEIESQLNGVVVTITKEHINKGEQKSCGRCPIALAIIDALKEKMSNFRLMVGSDETIIAIDDHMLDIANTDSMGDFVEEFDDAVEFEHFEPFAIQFTEAKVQGLRFKDISLIHR